MNQIDEVISLINETEMMEGGGGGGGGRVKVN